MYNREIKNKYIQEKNIQSVMPSNYLQCQFRKCSKFEERFKKDICNFTTQEIITYYKLLNIASLDSLIVMNSQFSMYCQWCMRNNLVIDGQNHFLEIDNNVLNQCINKALFDKRMVSREEIIAWAEQLPNPRDQYVMLALYEGLKGKDFCEIARLRPGNLDSEKRRAILCTGRKIPLSKELSRIIEESITEYTYYSLSGANSKVTTMIDNGYVLKDYPNARTDVSDFQVGRKVYNSITRSLKYVGASEFMTANGIAEAGKLHMIKQRAKELNITPTDYINSEHIREVEERYGCSIVKSTFIRKYQDYLK